MASLQRLNKTSRNCGIHMVNKNLEHENEILPKLVTCNSRPIKILGQKTVIDLK